MKSGIYMKSKFFTLPKIVLFSYVLLILIGVIVTLSLPPKPETDKQSSAATDASSSALSATEAKPTSHQIKGVPVIQQYDLKAGCETYACTMLLQSLGFDIDEYRFADNYLIYKDVYYDNDFRMYGPDMHSAFAGNVYEIGYGVYAPAMAKSINNFLSSVKSPLKAYAMEGVPLESLCETYIDNDIPVMIWATTNMWEPTPHTSWIVDYADENATKKVGDTETWYEHEHCLVLIGYDEKEYYFADSVAGAVSHFEKAEVDKRYKQIGTMSIVVK